jgi:flagellar secretion chaperone FliS
MFARSPAIQQYANVGVQSKVLAASPHRLIALLFDGAIESLNQAIEHLRANRVEQRKRMTNKAVTIIVEGLRAAIDRQQGGEIAANLDALYEYIVRLAFEASRQGNEAGYAEAIRLLDGLRSAWAEIDPDARKRAGAVPETITPPMSERTPSRGFVLA